MIWNPVLNKFIEIKEAAAATGHNLWDYNSDATTCLDYWAELTGRQDYTDLLRYLVIGEYKDFIQIGYGNYSDVIRGEEDVTMDSFWDLYDGIFRECRSVVINTKRDELVLTPFRKFRNLNEGEETSYENVRKRIKEASCVEFSNKLDGSMQAARFYRGEIVMAGSQSLDRANSWRLADGYRMLMADEGYGRMLRDNPDITFIFEYISQRDAHVVNYDVEGLFLIGARNVIDGREASYAEVLAYAAKYNLPTTEVYDKTLDEVVGELDAKSSDEAEGFVLNIDGFKVKIKYNDYVHMHGMLSALSSVNLIIRSIADNSFDDMIAKVPFAYRGRVMKIAEHVTNYKREITSRIEKAYAEAPKDDKKTFMIWVTENVESDIRGYVRKKYLGEPYNVLKRGERYLKLNQMGVSDYKEITEE